MLVTFVPNSLFVVAPPIIRAWWRPLPRLYPQLYSYTIPPSSQCLEDSNLSYTSILVHGVCGMVAPEMSREMYHGRLLGVTNSVALNR